MVELVEPFVVKLRSRSYPSLRLSSHSFPEETHQSVDAGAVSRGINRCSRRDELAERSGYPPK
ncbi:MAG: hypothetical protein ABI647_01565 [Gemmatimonadota bacterium]